MLVLKIANYHIIIIHDCHQPPQCMDGPLSICVKLHAPVAEFVLSACYLGHIKDGDFLKSQSLTSEITSCNW